MMIQTLAPGGAEFLGGDPLPAQYVKSHGSCARYVMTRKVVFVAEDTPLAEIADIFDARGIGRVPVVDGRQVVGIVTRADLLKTIAAKKTEPSGLHTHSDESIRERLLAELEQQAWWSPGWSQVFVTGVSWSSRASWQRKPKNSQPAWLRRISMASPR